MGTGQGKETVYKEYVFSNVASIFSSGAGAYNYTELAAMVGLKPTHNFRKRVRQMVSEGLIASFAAFTPRGGIEARFTALTNEETQEIAF